MKKIIAVSMCIIMIISMMPFTFAVAAEENGLQSEVYVSANDSIVNAMESVKDGGTIHIDGTIVVPADFNFYKNVTIVGDNKATDVLDLSAMPAAFNLGANLTLDYVTLKSTSAQKICANGYVLEIGENCATSGQIGIYGGAYQQSVIGNTSVTVLSGNYTEVYGGGYLGAIFGNTNVIVGGTADVHNYDNKDQSKVFLYHIYGGCYGSEVNGNTYVWVGGNANPGCTWTEHESNLYYVFGGGYNCQINGSTTVVLADKAEANYIYGGMCGSNTTITNGSNVYITGGYAMSVNGGSLGCDQGAGHNKTSNINVVMTGGTIQQMFGASKDADFTGNVNIKLLDGEVSRRVFGGCYNEVDLSGNWTTTQCVYGEIELVIGSGVDVTFTYTGGYIAKGNDHALSAHSRTNSIPLNDEGKPVEKATILYVDEPAMNKHSKNVKSGPNAGTAAYDSVQVLSVGDANLDGEITNADVLVIMKNIYDAEANPVLVFALADVNDDGEITNVDLLKVYKQIYAAQ